MMQCVITFDPRTGSVGWRTDAGFPDALLVNALELIKAVHAQKQLRNARQDDAPLVVMPDGLPPPPEFPT